MNSPVGEITITGRLAEASNATFLVTDADGVAWVHKPVAGEKPLWDFPTGTLSRREVAAFEVSRRVGFDVVPPTVWGEGPLGPGSFQRWVEGVISDTVDLLRPEALDETWLPIVVGSAEDDEPVVLVHRDDARLRRICLFDLVINNSDRKAGHLIDDGDRLWGVDHGVTFHADDKVRTVLWGFIHEALADDEVALLQRVPDALADGFEGVTDDELGATEARVADLLAAGVFPEPSGRWPAIPWPAW